MPVPRCCGGGGIEVRGKWEKALGKTNHDFHRGSFRDALAGLVPYAGGCVGCPRRCGFSYAVVACLSHCVMYWVGFNVVSGGLRKEACEKTNHDETRGSFSRRTGRASHFLGPVVVVTLADIVVTLADVVITVAVSVAVCCVG